jgi:CRISPR-associated exonuclease Cas4
MNISGNQILEYFKCKRQLSLSLMDLKFYNDSENVAIGKIIEESTYKRRSNKFKNFDIGGNVVDYIDFKNKIIYETKKSSKFLKFYQYQLKWYLYLINDDFRGIIEVPTERKKFDIQLTNDDVELFKETIKEINYIKENKIIIKDKKNKNFCKKCSFYEYCWI